MSNNQSSRSKPTLPSFQTLLRGLDELGPLEDSSSPVPGRGASPVYPGPLRTEDAHHPYNTQWHSSPMQEAFASTRPPSHPASWAGSSRDPSFVEGNQNQPEWSTSLPHHLSQSESSPRHGYSMRAHTLPQPFIQRPHSIPPSSSPRLNHIGPMGNPAIPRPPSANSYRFPAYSTKDERSRYPSLTHYTQPYGEEIPSLPRTVQRSAHGEESFALRASMHGRSSSESDNSYRAVIAVAGPSEDASPSSPSSTQDGKVARYPCSYCGKRFNRPSSLKIHVNIHTGDRPFVCPIPGCERTFSVLSNMRRHTKTHGNIPASTPSPPAGTPRSIGHQHEDRRMSIDEDELIDELSPNQSFRSPPSPPIVAAAGSQRRRAAAGSIGMDARTISGSSSAARSSSSQDDIPEVAAHARRGPPFHGVHAGYSRPRAYYASSEDSDV